MLVLSSPGTAEVGNPYTALLQAALSDLGVTTIHLDRRTALMRDVDIVHLHWPEDIVRGSDGRLSRTRLAALRSVLRWQQRRGAAVCWTVHNVEPHDGHDLAPVYRWLSEHVDGWFTLSTEAVRIARQSFPALTDVPVVVVRHGRYQRTVSSRAPSQATSGEPHRTMLSFGRLRPYKGFTDLVRQFTPNAEDDLRLMIAGPGSDEGFSRELATLTEARHDVELRVGHLPDEELGRLLKQARLVVLPYRSVLHSGAAMMALTHDRPVLAPRLGSLPELAEDAGPAWVRLYPPNGLTMNTLRDAMAWAEQPRPPLTLAGYGWDEIARRTREGYESFLAAARPGVTPGP